MRSVYLDERYYSRVLIGVYRLYTVLNSVRKVVKVENTLLFVSLDRLKERNQQQKTKAHDMYLCLSRKAKIGKQTCLHMARANADFKKRKVLMFPCSTEPPSPTPQHQ